MQDRPSSPASEDKPVTTGATCTIIMALLPLRPLDYPEYPNPIMHPDHPTYPIMRLLRLRAIHSRGILRIQLHRTATSIQPHRRLVQWLTGQLYLARMSFGGLILSRWSGHHSVRCRRQKEATRHVSSSGRAESAEHRRFRPELQRQARLRVSWSVAGTSGLLQPAAARPRARAQTVAANLGCSDQSNLNSVFEYKCD